MSQPEDLTRVLHQAVSIWTRHAQKDGAGRHSLDTYAVSAGLAVRPPILFSAMQ
jgi:hypothetical protein